MLQVIICEDDFKQRARIEAVVKKYIAAQDGDITLALSTGRPTDVLDFLEKSPNNRGLYFLDVDLQHKINGISLAAKIRAVDISAKIVFVTTHSELSHLVFTHKIEALDYIIKDMPGNIEKRVVECIQVAHKRYLSENIGGGKREYFKVNSGDQTWAIPYEDIIFLETHLSMTHKMILHMKDSQVEFRAAMREVAKMSPDFYRCHKSFIVNVKNIKRVDKSAGEIEMINGDKVPIAVRKISELLKIMG